MKQVNAYKLSEEWGALAPEYNQNEAAADWEATSEISYFCQTLNYWGGANSPNYWTDYNNWWTYTTPSNVQAYLGACTDPQMSIDYSTIWWVGDFKPISYWTNPFHYGLITVGDTYISDSSVFTATTADDSVNSEQYFTFIWTCVNGGLEWDSSGYHYHQVDGIIGTYTSQTDTEEKPNWTPTNPSVNYGAQWGDSSTACGMPLAFTGSQNMDYHYCYIGFQGHSPWLKDIYSGDPDQWNVDMPVMFFPIYFYYHFTGLNDWGSNYEHKSVADSLDYASSEFFGPGTSFSQTPLSTGWWEWLDLGEYGTTGWWWQKMNVFGNSNLVLPDGYYPYYP